MEQTAWWAERPGDGRWDDGRVPAGWAADVLRLLGGMMALPLAAMAGGLDGWLRGLRDLQQRTAWVPERARRNGVAPAPGPAIGPDAAAWAGPVPPPMTEVPDTNPYPQESRPMTDQDLSGDDIKVVRYRIMFTKRDLEHVFDSGEDIVTHDLSAGDFIGQKLGDFLEKLKAHKVEPPKKWEQANYPPKAKSDKDWELPDDDRHFLRVFIEVLQRIPREEPEYDRDQVKVLREISGKLA
jgi:hypothetical protein